MRSAEELNDLIRKEILKRVTANYVRLKYAHERIGSLRDILKENPADETSNKELRVCREAYLVTAESILRSKGAFLRAALCRHCANHRTSSSGYVSCIKCKVSVKVESHVDCASCSL